MKLHHRFLALSLLFLATSCNDANKAKEQTGSEFKPGQTIPKIELLNLSGQTVLLNDYLKEGPILLNIWATWCLPCVEEMEELIALDSAKLGNPALRVVSINMDSNSERNTVLEFIKNKHIQFPVLLDPEWTTIESLGLKGYPETFLIGPNSQFISLNDPEGKANSIRILSKRNWASQNMKIALCEALKSCN